MLLAPLAGLAGAAEEADPLAKARSLSYRRQFLEAIAAAKGVAASEKETPDRRAKAFDILYETYSEIGAPRFALEACQQAIAAFGRDSEAAATAWYRIARFHYGREEVGETIAVLEKAAAELDLAKLPVAHQVNLLGLLAACRERLGQTQAALATYEKLASLAKAGPELSASLAKAARLYAEIQEFDKAHACLARIHGKTDSETAAETSKAYQELFAKLAAVGRYKESRALCRKIITLFARREPYTAATALLRLLEAGDGDAGMIDVAASLTDEEARALTSEEAIATVVPAALRAGRTADLAQVYTRAMLTSPLDESLAYGCLRAIADLRTREGLYDEAAAAAAAAYAVTGFSSYYVSGYTRAIELVCQALRARDGHLASGNAFRRYQVLGPAGPDAKLGTADDIANPLAGAAFRLDPDLARLYETALAAQPPSVAGHRARGWIYLLWCKPREALREFKREFALCSLDSTEFTRAAQDVALGLKALNGTPVGMDAFALFQRYGPDGPDGKPRTADDLKDPLKDF